MRSQQSFLKSGRLNAASELVYKGKFILDTFEDGLAYLHVRIPAYAQMFASPAVKRDASGGTSVAWYSEASGAIQKWADVDQTTKTRATGILSALVRSVLKWAEDPDDEMAQILLLWLHVLSLQEDLLLVDGQPILTNWGIIPEAVADDPAAVWRHFESGLGQFVLSDAEPVLHPRPMPADTSANPAAGAPSKVSQIAPETPVLPAIGDASPRHCSIVAVSIACAVAFVILLLLLIPGILVYPSASKGLLLTDEALAETETVLRERIAAMRALDAGGSCKMPQMSGITQGILPGTGALGLVPPSTGIAATPSPQTTPPPALNPALANILPPPPSTLKAPGDGNTGSVVDLLEKATVIVVAAESGTGTGFFISPRQVVTNRHVVDSAVAGKIMVSNGALGGSRNAKLVSMSPTSEIGSPDLAILEIDGAPSRFKLDITSEAGKGENVLAAGFPGIVMDTDRQYQALMAGISTAIPDMVLTQGIITVFQTSDANVPLVLHSADISPGNSGGPLTDLCGRVLGINTFLRTEADNQIRLNFALKSESLLAYLQKNGVSVAAATGRCTPQSIADVAVQTPVTLAPGPSTPEAPAFPTPAPAPATEQ